MISSAFALFLAAIQGMAPLWSTPLDGIARDGAHLFPDGSGGLCLLVPLGEGGLGGWNRSGAPLPGFPLSPESGVAWRPAEITAAGGARMLAYGDNRGRVHLVDLSGTEARGWPVNTGSSIITGISGVDLDDDGVQEVALGTSDGLVWLLDSGGSPVQGWPLDLESQLLWQPTQISLGGGGGRGLVCALNNSMLTVVGRDGGVLPGWPVTLQFPAGTAPVSADVNGDGQADLVFATQNRRLNLLNSQGRQIQGWPHYLDERPVRGAAAAGRARSGSSGLQVAVATIDGLVYLVKSDGSLEGTWRWPNSSESAPFQPLILNTAGGRAVLTATESGLIHAWNADGEPVAGFPFQHSGRIAFAPVAGDLNGDGLMELVVVGSDGTITAYSLQAAGSEPDLWTMPLGDRSNSGTPGGASLPVATVGSIESRQSGDVTVPYSVQGAGQTGVSLFYSVDAGYSWTRTENFTRGQGSLIWHTEADLPHRTERQVAVKVTPMLSSSPGECGTSGIFQVDNNVPPVILVHAPEALGDGRFSFTYSLEDPEGDIVQIQAQFSTNGGESWNTMHLTGSTLSIEPWFYGEPFDWSSGRDVDPAELDSVMVRIRAADSKPGPWFVLEELVSLDGRAPEARVVAPAYRAGGDVRMMVSLSDPGIDPLDVKYEYTTDGGATWLPATVSGPDESGASNYSYSVLWLSETDLPAFDGEGVRFRGTPSGDGPGIAVPSSPFRLDNNHAPIASILSPQSYSLFRGMVPVSFSLSDPEGDRVTLGLQYRSIGENRWIPAAGVVNPGPFGPAEYSSVLYWNSSQDLPSDRLSDLEIRLVAMDRDSVFSMETGPIALDNQNLPEVVRAGMASSGRQTGRAEISYEIVDPSGRTVDLAVHFSLDGGGTWRPAAVAGQLAGLRGGAYNGSFTWNWRADAGPTPGAVRIRLTPRFEGEGAGRPRIIYLTLP